MPLVQREFIHHQTPHIPRNEPAMQPFQALLIDGLDGMPVQSGQLRDMSNR